MLMVVADHHIHHSSAVQQLCMNDTCCLDTLSSTRQNVPIIMVKGNLQDTCDTLCNWTYQRVHFCEAVYHMPSSSSVPCCSSHIYARFDSLNVVFKTMFSL